MIRSSNGPSLGRLKLAVGATEPTEDLGLGFGLDTFGHRADAQVPAQLDDTVHDGCGALPAAQRLHGALVDLDGVHREVAKERERRVAGPEVVQGDRHAHLGDPHQFTHDQGA
jgi:hypothetical protein